MAFCGGHEVRAALFTAGPISEHRLRRWVGANKKGASPHHCGRRLIRLVPPRRKALDGGRMSSRYSRHGGRTSIRLHGIYVHARCQVPRQKTSSS